MKSELPGARPSPGRARLWLSIALLCMAVPCASAPARTAAEPNAAVVLEVFTRHGCPHCAAAGEFLEQLGREQPDLRIVVRDVVDDAAALARLRRLADENGLAMVGVPAFHIGGQLVIGFDSDATTGAALRGRLAAVHADPATAGGLCPDLPGECVPPAPITVNVFGHSLDADRLGLVLFSLALGLIDGFNPCSMWVLVFMLAMLAPLRNRRRMLLVMGTFVAIEGIAYFAFMAAWLNAFMAVGVSRYATLLVGLAGCAAGLVHIKDFFAYGRGISLSIPSAARPGIYARIRRIAVAEHAGAAVVATAVLALLVQGVEFLCTAGIPALFTRILTLRNLEPWRHYAYLLLYNLMYMLDDVIVLGVGVVTLSQRRLQEREGRWLKLLSGTVLLALGVHLLLRLP